MNVTQKIVIAIGAALVALRAIFPVKYVGFPGLRFEGGDFPEFMHRVDWQATGLHIVGIVVVTVALVLIMKKK